MASFTSNKPFRSAPFGSQIHGAVPPPLMNSSEGPVHAGMQQNASDMGDRDGIDHGVTAVPNQHGFSPYDFNGGTVAAVAGADYCVVAADTRLSSGYEIKSRNVTKMHAVTGKCVLASSGCKTDVDQLRSVLDIKMKVCYKCFYMMCSYITFVECSVRLRRRMD
jgi:hypothetical protein